MGDNPENSLGLVTERLRNLIRETRVEVEVPPRAGGVTLRTEGHDYLIGRISSWRPQDIAHATHPVIEVLKARPVAFRVPVKSSGDLRILSLEIDYEPLEKLFWGNWLTNAEKVPYQRPRSKRSLWKQISQRGGVTLNCRGHLLLPDPATITALTERLKALSLRVRKVIKGRSYFQVVLEVPHDASRGLRNAILRELRLMRIELAFAFRCDIYPSNRYHNRGSK